MDSELEKNIENIYIGLYIYNFKNGSINKLIFLTNDIHLCDDYRLIVMWRRVYIK